VRLRSHLQFRVALFFAVFGAIVSLLLSIGLYIATHDMERRLIDETLAAEIGVSRSVNNVNLMIAISNSSIFRENRDSTLFFNVIAIHSSFIVLFMRTKSTRLL